VKASKIIFEAGDTRYSFAKFLNGIPIEGLDIYHNFFG